MSRVSENAAAASGREGPPARAASMFAAESHRHMSTHVSSPAPIIEVLRTATSIDPEITGLWPQDVNMRFTVQAAAAKALMAKPGARAGVSPEHAADLLYGVLSPELYLLYVRDRGWTHGQWEQWVYDTLRSQLCDG
jgi:hypothetical protein